MGVPSVPHKSVHSKCMLLWSKCTFSVCRNMESEEQKKKKYAAELDKIIKERKEISKSKQKAKGKLKRDLSESRSADEDDAQVSRII